MSESTEIALSAPAAAAQGESIWGAVREALRGSRRSYTEGPIGRAILILAIPMVLEMMMESVFVVCDVFFVSKLGPDAVLVRNTGATYYFLKHQLENPNGPKPQLIGDFSLNIAGLPVCPHPAHAGWSSRRFSDAWSRWSLCIRSRSKSLRASRCWWMKISSSRH